MYGEGVIASGERCGGECGEDAWNVGRYRYGEGVAIDGGCGDERGVYGLLRAWGYGEWDREE